MKTILILVVIIAYLFFTISILFYDPKIWPDEAYLADIAYNFQNKGRLGTDLWGDMFTGIREQVYWYPPLYLYTLSLSFKIFGFSITTQRFLSIFMGGSFIFALFILFYNMVKKFKYSYKTGLITSLILGLLAIDQVFLRIARVGRAEIMVMLLGSIAFLIYELRGTKKQQFAYLGCGLLCGLASITHIWGVIFFASIFIDTLLKRKFKILRLSVIGFFIPILLWLISIYPKHHIFLEQLSLQAHFRGVIKSDFLFTYLQNNIEYKVALSIYAILTLVLIFSTMKIRQFRHFSLLVLMGWLVYFFGELEWYMTYFAGFLYLLSALVIYHLSLVRKASNKFLSAFIISLLLALLYLNIKNYSNSYQQYAQYLHSYNHSVNRITTYIPKGSVIYLSSIPDLYFNLKDRYRLYEFPTVYPKIDKFIEVLNNSDFIIINYHLERMLVGELLIKYIEQNTLEELAFPLLDNNPVSLIKLKPRNARIKPANSTAH